MTHDLLASLGWSDHFARQLGADPDADRDPSLAPARLIGVERDHVIALDPARDPARDPAPDANPGGPVRLVVPRPEAAGDSGIEGGTGGLAVGDWVLTDGVRVLRRLAPTTEIARRVAGDTSRRQLVVANVDALAIVTSCNADFNPGRIERYLAVAAQAGCLPLVVLTKADLADDPGAFAREARRLSALATVMTLDARDPSAARRLDPWCGPGSTLALVGSSGVGKTTLQNTLTGTLAATQGVREDDAKGRHTTTARTLRRTLAGGCLIDTPGMRELGLVDAASGVAEVFADVEAVARGCRFRDCTHHGEPGCAVRAAVEAGALDEARVRRHEKLAREERFNTEARHEAHARHRAFGKMHRQIKARGVRGRGAADD